MSKTFARFCQRANTMRGYAECALWIFVHALRYTFLCIFDLWFYKYFMFFLARNPFASRFAAHKPPIKLLHMPVSCLIVRVIVLCYQIKIVCIQMEMNAGTTWYLRWLCWACKQTSCSPCCCLFHLQFFHIFWLLCHFQMIIAKSFQRDAALFAVLYCCSAFQNIYLLRLFTENQNEWKRERKRWEWRWHQLPLM